MLDYFKERNIELENEGDEERRERDSNPRSGCPESDFQDRRLKPLGHPSNIYIFYLLNPMARKSTVSAYLIDGSYHHDL